MDDDDGSTAPATVWLVLLFIIVSAISFWAQAVVTEERFVPALNAIAVRLRIPDDVAGATLMAAGASSPELFASLLSLFVTHSALGMGTIVGSEIFNQLCICAGAVFAARNKQLKLDRAILIREISFYALALVLLLVSLSDRQSIDDDSDGYDHIFISLGDGLLLLGGYLLYVLVCAYFEQILSLIRRLSGTVDGESGGESGDEYSTFEDSARPNAKKQHISITVPALPFVRQLSHEPRGNFHSVLSQDDLMSLDAGAVVSDLHVDQYSFSGDQHSERNDAPNVEIAAKSAKGAPVGTTKRPGRTSRLFAMLVDTRVPKPSALYGLDEIVKDEAGVEYSCFLWQQSLFYNKARIDINAWHLRWFTFTASFIESVPNRSDCALHRLRYTRLHRIEVDRDHLVLKVCSSSPRGGGDIFMAPTRQVLEVAVGACERIITNQEELLSPRSTGAGDLDDATDPNATESEEVISLVEFPYGASPLSAFFHIVLFPIKALMHYTVPDVRLLPANKTSQQLLQAIVAVFSCVVWLVVGSYAMVTSLERLGELMGIPDSVMGVTVSAAGTSLPNYVASQVAARQGLGNMAVSNAFGSNVFNICIGLGLPWTLYTGLATHGQPYHGLRDDGITESTFVLAVVLLVFIVLALASNFVLYRWHAYVFLFIYACYVVYAVGQVYV